METVLVATTAAVGADDAPAVGGAQLLLAGALDDGGYGPLPPGGLPVRVTLNGGRRDADLLHGAPTFRFVPADGLRLTEVFPQGATHAGGAPLTLYGEGFVDLGGAYCAFGTLRPRRGAMPVDAAVAADGVPPTERAAADLAGDGVRRARRRRAARAAHAGDDPRAV